jgi:TolB protein
MKIMNWLIVTLVITSSCLFSANECYDDSQIVVCLETEKSLLPIYLSTITNENSGFDLSYLKQLEEVFAFDLNQNGRTEALQQKPKMEAILKGLSFEELGRTSEWKAQKVLHIIKTRVKNKKLEARLFFVDSETVRSVEGLELTGDLNIDRRKIHALSDLIHQALFNQEGIAKLKFLYVVKEKGMKGEWISNVCEADYDGHNVRQITVDAGYCITPVYVPAKKNYAPGSFLYVSYKTGQSKIYLASLKDGKNSRFNDFKGNQLMPAISISGESVAFISDYTGNPDLFIQPFSKETGALDKPQQIYALKHATQGSPTLSPDGKQIAFVSNKDGSPKVYVMNIPEKGAASKDIKPQLISKQERENSAPVWSPDGSKIAYCSMIKGTRQIMVYDFITKQEKQITTGSENKENPTFAPNSLHLIFNSTGKNGGELYLMNLNQPKAIKISRGSGEKHFPNFQPN